MLQVNPANHASRLSCVVPVLPADWVMASAELRPEPSSVTTPRSADDTDFATAGSITERRVMLPVSPTSHSFVPSGPSMWETRNGSV